MLRGRSPGVRAGVICEVTDVIRFQALGSVGLTAPDGRELRSVLARPKLLALLTYLSAQAPGPFHRRDTLLGLLWPEASDERARAALRQALYNLRSALGEGVVVARSEDEVGLDATRLWSDVAELEAALAGGERENALELYRGDLLPGFFLPEAPEFERWLDDRRASLRRRAAAAACEMAEQAAAVGNGTATGRWGQRALELAPLDEGVARTVFSLLDHAGDRAGAVQQYAVFAHRLEEELGIEPSPETRALIATIAERSAERSPAPPSADSAAVPSGGRFAAPPVAPALGVGEEAAAPRAVPRSAPRHAVSWGVAVGALAVVAVAAVATATLRKEPAHELAWGRVAMGPFENRTGDASLDAVGAMTADWAAGTLRRAALVEVADPEVTRQALLFSRAGADGASRSAVRVTADASGARLVVSGSYDLVGDTLVLVARLTDAERDVVLTQLDPVRAPRSDPTHAIADMASRLTGAVATLTDRSVPALADPGRQPPTYEAYRAYAEAEALFNQAYTPGQGRLHAIAVQRYLEAFTRDTTLVEALMRAAEAQAFLGERHQADSLAAIVVARRGELSPYSRRRLDLLVATLAGELEPRLRAARLCPDRPTDLAEAALLSNRPHEAISALTGPVGEAWRRSIADLGWEWLDVYTARLLASAYHAVGDYAAELQLAEAMRTRYPRQSSGLAMEVQALAGLGRSADVERQVDSARVVPQGDGPPPPWIMLQGASELRAHGDTAGARRAAGRALAWLDAVRQGDPRSDTQILRVAAFLLEDRLDDAGALADTLLGRAPGDLTVLGIVGVLAARRGDRDGARRRLAELSAPTSTGPQDEGFRWRAAILASLGDQAGAIEELRRAAAHGRIMPDELHRDLLLDPLRGSPAFQELLRPKG